MSDRLTATEQAALAQRLREVREYLGLSQQFVADHSGIPRSAISDIERGVRRVDSLELRRLSKVYRYPATFFLGEDEPVEDSATVVALRQAAQELTEADQEEVLRFATFLRHYGQSDRRRGDGPR